MNIKRLSLLILCISVSLPGVRAQQMQPVQQTPESPTVAIKTNLLYGAGTLTPNLGVEIGLGRKTTLDVGGGYNPWNLKGSATDNKKLVHWLVQPEFRYWLRERFDGHFFGVHAFGGMYNIGGHRIPLLDFRKQFRYEGYAVGGGVSYGYLWNWSPRWGMEFTVGVGAAYLNYDKYDCAKCSDKIGNFNKTYLGPTRAGITLVYKLGGRKKAAAPIYVAPVVQVELKPEPQPEPLAPYVPQYEVSYLIPEAEAVKTRSEAGKAYLDFAVGKSEIVPSFKNNASELEKIFAMIRSVRENPDAEITGIAITGYASPDGSWASNMTLSGKRAESLKNQIKMVTGYPESFFTVEGRGEDWATLDTLVSQSDMTDKYAILGIIRGTDVFDGREKKLMMLSAGNPYRRMKAEMFPQLRRTEYRLDYKVVPFTVEKGKEVFRSRPSSLSLNEMFLIANTYEMGSDAFNEVFETAARMFPQSDAANLNAAASALSRKDAVTAERYLSKVAVRSAEWYNDMGVLRMQQGRLDESESYLRRAQSSGAVASADAAANLATLAKLRQQAVGQ